MWKWPQTSQSQLIMQVCLILLPGQPSRGESQLVGSGVLLGGETPLGRGGKIQNNEVNQLKWPITRFKHGTRETTVMCSVLQKSRYVTFIGTDINFNFGGDVEDNCYNIQSDVWAQLVDWHGFFFLKCQETKKPKQRRKRSNKQTTNQQPTDQLTTNNQTTNQHPTNKNCKNVHIESCYSNSEAHMVIIHLVILWTSYPAGFTGQDIHQNVETFSRCVLISADFRSISLCGLWLGHTLASSSAQIPHVLFQGQSVSPTERSRQPRIKRSSGSLAIC